MKWQSLSQAIPRLHKIEQALRDCHTILVATDPGDPPLRHLLCPVQTRPPPTQPFPRACPPADREGEAISWHVLDILASSGALQGKHVRRVTFTEVTEDAIRRAVQSPREVSQDLVDAYRARLGLDFLVGFSVSPLLWRKVPGAHSKSAGRVQSVALRLIAEREAEREGFCPVTHWSIHVLARGPNGLVIPLRLTKVDGKVTLVVGRAGMRRGRAANGHWSSSREAVLRVMHDSAAVLHLKCQAAP